jgi:hypothetical protein
MGNEKWAASALTGTANLDNLPIALVLFLVVEIEKLSQEGQITDEQKASLRKNIEDFEKQFNSGTLTQKIESAFSLGVSYEAITGTVATEQSNELHILKMKDERRNSPIRRKNMQAKVTRELVQLVASMLWDDDKNDQIRLGEMCQMSWNRFHDLISNNSTFSAQDKKIFTDRLPSKADDLKPWLRKIAPDYAKKRGRPKGN